MGIFIGNQKNTSSPEYQTQAINTLNLTTAQATISAQQRELDTQNAKLAAQKSELTEQKAALKTQAQVNTQQAQLLQGYQTQEETSRKEGLVEDLMKGLSNQEHRIVIDALKALNTEKGKPKNLITFSSNNVFGIDKQPDSCNLDLNVKTIAEDLTRGNLALADKLAKFILAYNNLPANISSDGAPVYEFEQRRDTQAGSNFVPRNVKFKLPELTEGENSKGSPIINLDGIPYPNDTQKQAEIDNRKTVLEQIKEKIMPPIATVLISGLVATGINSTSKDPAGWLPDLTPPNPQVLVKPNQSPASILELSQVELLKMRSESFQKVEVKPGDGYTQLFERYLSKDLKKLGIEKITPENTELAFIVNLSQAMTNLENQANNLDLPKLTDPNMIKKIPDGVTEVYIPKEGVLDSLINGYKIPPAPGSEVQQKHS